MAVSTGPDPKWVRMTSLEDGKPVHYAIKVTVPCSSDECVIDELTDDV